MAPGTGLVSLAACMYAVFAFNFAVVAAGAWARHPVAYVLLNAASITLVLLFAAVVCDLLEPTGVRGGPR